MILEKKGFVLSRVKGSHHIFYQPETKRRVVPVHGRDLPPGMLLENKRPGKAADLVPVRIERCVFLNTVEGTHSPQHRCRDGCGCMCVRNPECWK